MERSLQGSATVIAVLKLENEIILTCKIPQIMAELAVLVSWQILKDSQDFLHTFSMALYHKWDVKNGFAYVLTLISCGLGGVFVCI